MSKKPINKTKEISAVEAVNTKLGQGKKKSLTLKKKKDKNWLHGGHSDLNDVPVIHTLQRAQTDKLLFSSGSK